MQYKTMKLPYMPRFLQLIFMLFITTITTASPPTAQQQSQFTRTYPLDHMRGVSLTTLILQFLHGNKTMPLHELPNYPSAMQTLKGGVAQCQICDKVFSNSTYLAIHYSVKHGRQMFEYFDENDMYAFQILYHPYPAIPQPQILQFCHQFYNRLQKRITDTYHHDLDSGRQYFRYVQDHPADEFCQIVVNKLYERQIWERVVQVVGFATLIVLMIGYLLYSLQVQRKQQNIIKTKNY